LSFGWLVGLVGRKARSFSPMVGEPAKLFR
jgi:hypothetical protein